MGHLWETMRRFLRHLLAGLAARLGAGLGLLPLVPVILLLELLHPAGGVDVLHLAGEERVAGGTDFDHDRLLGAAGGELVAAAAGDGGLFVLGVNTFLHSRLRWRMVSWDA